MYAPKLSAFDVPWLSQDPDSACCMCPDAFREKRIPVDYCPQHGDKPDFSLCHDPEAGRRWRAAQKNPDADPSGGVTEVPGG